MPKLGNNIRRLRETSGWTQARLGERLGVSESTISLYESDKREPDLTMLSRLADLFHVSTDYLLGRCDEPTLVYLREGGLPAEALDRIEEYKELMRLKYEKRR